MKTLKDDLKESGELVLKMERENDAMRWKVARLGAFKGEVRRLEEEKQAEDQLSGNVVASIFETIRLRRAYE